MCTIFFVKTIILPTILRAGCTSKCLLIVMVKMVEVEVEVEAGWPIFRVTAAAPGVTLARRSKQPITQRRRCQLAANLLPLLLLLSLRLLHFENWQWAREPQCQQMAVAFCPSACLTGPSNQINCQWKEVQVGVAGNRSGCCSCSCSCSKCSRSQIAKRC